MEEFEKILTQMTKPEISELKHMEALGKAISQSKSKLALSWWWLSIPTYVICMLLIKSHFMPHTTFSSNMHDMEGKFSFSILFFLVMPIVFIILNAFSIRKIFILSGGYKQQGLLRVALPNLMFMALSLAIIIIYLLN